MSHPASMRLTAYIMKHRLAVQMKSVRADFALSAADTIIPDFSQIIKMIIDQTYLLSFIQYDE